MIRRVTARAYANIALVKYWGKQPGQVNMPATPSIALTLDKLKTETIVERADSREDRFFINNKPADSISSERLKEYLNFWRKNNLTKNHFVVKSKNAFPTKAGLASSSSGYAALAMALSAFSDRRMSTGKLSQLARIGSGSAARSVVGGLAALPNGFDASAKLLLPPDKIRWGMLIAIVDNNEKEVGSREGMELSRKTSFYYECWLKCAAKDYKDMLKAIRKLDFSFIGQIAEANSLAMHACMIATRPSLMYWNAVTLDLLQAVRRWRQSGLEAYATMDAGPHVAFFCGITDLDRVAVRAKRITGVQSVIKCHPAEGASITQWQ